jgi:hypothetical protein
MAKGFPAYGIGCVEHKVTSPHCPPARSSSPTCRATANPVAAASVPRCEDGSVTTPNSPHRCAAAVVDWPRSAEVATPVR